MLEIGPRGHCPLRMPMPRGVRFVCSGHEWVVQAQSGVVWCGVVGHNGCWSEWDCFRVDKAKNPAPCVLHVAMTDDPMVFMDNQLAAQHQAGAQHDDYLEQFKIDLPIFTIDFMFRGTIGFALRTDPQTKLMDVIGIKEDGQARDLGLHRGDTLLKINETDVSRSPGELCLTVSVLLFWNRWTVRLSTCWLQMSPFRC